MELVIPFAQGGGTDRVGRFFAQFAAKHLGGEMFVSNRTGGSGAVGFSHGARARADGHVITMAVTTLTVAPHTVAGYPVQYDSFTPICLLAAIPMTVSVRADSAFQTIDELIADAKSAPGKLKIGAAGAATNNYLAGVAFAGSAGIDATMVPYEGAGPALVALLGGHVDVAMADSSEALPYTESKQNRVLLVLGDQPSPDYPDVPTSASKGWEANVASFRGIAGPKGMPADITARWVDVCAKTAADPDFIAEMKKFGMDVTLIKGDAFGAWLADQHATYEKAAKAAGLQPK
ncbi:MAG: tripartite tricarboxylate transporter substrate binding protein [Alphaproteobacteria bacterium]